MSCASAAKRINKKINEYIEDNGMISDLEMEHIIDAELAAEREAAEGLAKAVRQYISCEANERNYLLLQMAYKLKAYEERARKGE